MTDNIELTEFALSSWNLPSKKPKVSGDYLIWTSGGIATVANYSAKYDGWGITSGGRRDYEIKDVERWASIFSPTMY